MPSICELKMELKAKGIKGITGLNKAGLEALLKGGREKSFAELAKIFRFEFLKIHHPRMRNAALAPLADS